MGGKSAIAEVPVSLRWVYARSMKSGTNWLTERALNRPVSACPRRAILAGDRHWKSMEDIPDNIIWNDFYESEELVFIR
jgi:hypothetical protein